MQAPSGDCTDSFTMTSTTWTLFLPSTQQINNSVSTCPPTPLLTHSAVYLQTLIEVIYTGSRSWPSKTSFINLTKQSAETVDVKIPDMSISPGSSITVARWLSDAEDSELSSQHQPAQHSLFSSLRGTSKRSTVFFAVISKSETHTQCRIMTRYLWTV